MSATGGMARVFERGAAAVETALLTPFLATLLIGAIEIGAAFNHSLDMEGAARDAARYASEHPDRTKTEIIAHGEAAVDSSATVTVTLTPDVEKPCEGREGDIVEVVISTIETLDLLFVQTATITLSGNGTFVCLAQ